MIRSLSYILLTAIFLLGHSQVEAGWIVKNGHFYDADEVATLSLEEHFALGEQAYKEEDFREAARQFRIITRNFPNTKLGKETSYFLGISYFHIEEYEYANQELTHYLKSQSNPKYFEEAFSFKFLIAQEFRNGARRRIFGYRKMPKWLSGQKIAFEIYDEIISTLPCHELAAQSLWAKANLHWKIEDYKKAVESFHTLIRRFPKHELTPESYLAINRLYFEQSQREFQNPDILALSQLNLRKFQQDFPGEERHVQAEEDALAIKEIYAQGLFETGQFYERVKQPKASIIYYKTAIKQFPETSVAKHCYDRLEDLESHHPSKVLSATR